MQRIIRVAACSGLVSVLAAALPLGAAAHEHRDILNGQYEIVIGFLDEPAFVGEKNGLSLRVTRHDAAASPAAEPAEGEEEVDETGTPIEGLVGTLQAEVIFGDQTMDLPLTPAFGEPGAYESVFFPMAEGDYTFHIFGEIEGNAVDESFTSSPEGFDSVQAREPFEFPKEESSNGADGVVAGTLGSDDADGLNGGLTAGLGILAGTAGLWLVQRRSGLRRSTPIGSRGAVRP
jgi:hypothetical protein